MPGTSEQLKRAFFDRDAVLSRIDAGTARLLSRFGAYVRTRARSSIRRRKKVSEPGRPPSAHGDHLKRILFAYDAGSKSVIVGPVLLNSAKRRGRSGSQTVPELLEYGGTVTVDRPRAGPKTLHYRARPFMRPAFQSELTGRLAAQLKGLMGQG